MAWGFEDDKEGDMPLPYIVCRETSNQSHHIQSLCKHETES